MVRLWHCESSEPVYWIMCVCVVLSYVLGRESCFVSRSCFALGPITWLRDDIISSSALNYIHMSLFCSLSPPHAASPSLSPAVILFITLPLCSYLWIAIFTFLLPSSISAVFLCLLTVSLNSNLMCSVEQEGTDYTLIIPLQDSSVKARIKKIWMEKINYILAVLMIVLLVLQEKTNLKVLHVTHVPLRENCLALWRLGPAHTGEIYLWWYVFLSSKSI